MTVLGDIIRNAVLEHGDRVAVIDPQLNRTVTYREIDRLINTSAAALLGLGLTQGDHVAIYQRNSLHWLVAEGACAKAGLVVIPLNVYLAPGEIEWLLRHSEARAVLFDSERAGTLASVRARAARCEHLLWVGGDGGALPEWATSWPDLLARTEPNDPRPSLPAEHPHRIMYTSATTGFPKGVICPNEVIVGSITTALANQSRDVGPSDRLLVATPLTHLANGYFWPFFCRGAATVVARQFHPDEFCRLIADFAITHAVLAPTLIIMLLSYLVETPESVKVLRASSLRALWYAGSPIPIPVAERAEQLLGPILNQQYGMTELFSSFPAHGVTTLTSEWHGKKLGSCGRPVIGAVVRVVDDHGNELPAGDDGEVVVKTLSRVGGYWRLPEGPESAFRAGWLHTGDIGSFDDDGFLFIKDRKNDMIISGGLNVYPAEVESVIAAHPAVAQCAVVGIKHSKWIEVPCAVVVKRPSHEVSEQELIDFARDRISHYKAPKRVVFVDSLPISSIGKILRREIRKDLERARVTT